MSDNYSALARRKDVVVTGLGLVTPAGIGVEATWQGLLAGRPTAAPDPVLAGMPVDFSCRVPEFDGRELLGHRLARRLDRGAQLTIVAVREALADAGLTTADWDPARVAVVLGVGSNSLQHYPEAFRRLDAGHPDRISPLMITRSVPGMVAGEVALAIGSHGPSMTISTACASGSSALAVARDLLRGGSCDIAVAGGGESTYGAIYAATFGQMRALSTRTHDPAGASRPFDRDRDGFVLAEGAGILVLERAEHAAARRARPRARLAGVGSSSDAYHFTAPHPQGRGAADAMDAALRDAGLSPSEIGHVNAHGTSTPLNDIAESRALRQVFGTPPPVTAPKGTLGHAIGGSGGIEAACCVLSLERQVVPPTANLDVQDPGIDLDIVTKTPRDLRLTSVMTNSFGFGGQNAVAVFLRP
ncbi:beta-ketoacyl-[acyl-carrier-protein] synthase family protein [Streptomyces niveiscabiei]|uniref:beta-ketoacyl-[acyl-carrier-protein] synthase family protein n=1 Tax=Streptomyces niveiscabiei TaxID=164115 RepID=UPI0029B955C0|nr:beta-ketoacyl-[acyl-carrier-protein] synthase family protein [Streptomyces niveiscabiei]MDX3386035.1 beta-ketoacyl-[acyl-carrier-protein] synthase family protein [Streptomyces niveiscabiei]